MDHSKFRGYRLPAVIFQTLLTALHIAAAYPVTLVSHAALMSRLPSGIRALFGSVLPDFLHFILDLHYTKDQHHRLRR